MPTAAAVQRPTADRHAMVVTEQRKGSACEDKRITRSKAAMRDALISLMEERGFDAIKVGDLCTAAGINRGTFYNHYSDKDALLADFEEQIIADLDSFKPRLQQLAIKDVLNYRLTKRPLPVLVDLFDYLREQGPFLHAVMGPGGDIRFNARLRETVCTNLVFSLLHERYHNDPDPFVTYYVSFYANAYLGIIATWIESGMRESSEQMAQIALRMLFIKPGEAIRM
jgi:AcrR family transcriptional regulator